MVTRYIAEFINTLTCLVYSEQSLAHYMSGHANKPYSTLRALWDSPTAAKIKYLRFPHAPLLGLDDGRYMLNPIPRQPKVSHSDAYARVYPRYIIISSLLY